MRVIHRYMAFVLIVISVSGLQIKSLPKTANEGIRGARVRGFIISHYHYLRFLSGRKSLNINSKESRYFCR